MSLRCSAEWESGCLRSLMTLLVAGDHAGMSMWIANHCGTDDERWDLLAASLASIAADAFQAVAMAHDRERGIADDAEAMFMPVHHPSAGQVERDAGLLVTMSMNKDAPGILGVIAAARSRDEFEDLCGAVASIATHALRAEIVMHGKGGAS